MPLDGIVLSSVVWELDGLLRGGRVEKINQTEKDEVVLTCHTASGKYNLLISANPSNPRMHLTTGKKDNPLLAPPFCMVLRKHLRGARIVSMIQSGYDRIVTVDFEVFDELEGPTEKHLIVEIMGKYSNIILTGKAGIIYDAIRHVDSTQSSLREVLPARHYAPPPAQDKISPEEGEKIFNELLIRGGSLKKTLLDVASGFSPMLCSCVCEAADLSPTCQISSLSEESKKRLLDVLCLISRELSERKYSPAVFYEEGTEKPIDFHCLSVAFAGDHSKKFNTANLVLDTFFTEKDRMFRLSQKKTSIMKKVTAAVEHCLRKKDIYTETVADKKECELLKTRGELIKSYIYMIEKGSESFTCVNYFDDSAREITIPLDKNLTPAANAALYFKKYRKQKSAIESAEKFLADVNEEIIYLESVKTLLENCSDEESLGDIREELSRLGYIRQDDPSKSYKTRKAAPKRESVPLKTVSKDGYEILIGKNNLQNDMLTFKIASPDDIWLHVKDAPGSHVILRMKKDSGTSSGGSIEEAASYAVGYSSYKEGAKALVDYTRVKYVKKPSGARPGMVIFTNQKTILVSGKKIE